jgi:hypothetical protein
MKSIVGFAAALAGIALSLGTSQASDWVAAYALVDKVVLEPDADKPEQIQIWGVFATAKPNDRNLYDAPRRGYLYFKLPQEKKDLARNEWSDFKGIAGKRKVVGFGNRYTMKLTVRKADEKPKAPDVYEVELGVVKDRSDTDYPPVKSLLEFSDR